MNLAEMLQEAQSNETINVNFVVSKIEMLLGILKFTHKYTMPNSGISDLCYLFNSFVDQPILPQSRYKLDQLFYPNDSVQHHAVCPGCKNYIGRYNRNQGLILCEICNININLKEPSYHDYFITLDIKDELKNVIESNDAFYTQVIAQREAINQETFQDISDGQKYRRFVDALPDDQKQAYATATLNSDGSPVFKSSKFSIWPIQVVVNEIPLDQRIKKSIIYSLWFGHDKPNMTFFLKPFVESMNNLSRNGIPCNINNTVKNIHVYTICCCRLSCQSTNAGFHAIQCTLWM